jgi:hypothetical protein
MSDRMTYQAPALNKRNRTFFVAASRECDRLSNSDKIESDRKINHPH